MTDSKLRWGILGTGNIASRFAGQVPRSATGKVVAVGSRSIDSANAFADRWDIANRHGSYDDLLADETVDAVYVATPHPMHVEWAIKAAEAGKHVLCEKPLAINRAWAEAMIEAAVANDVFLMEAYMYRCLPQTKLIAQLVRDGELGTVHQIQATCAFAASYQPESRMFADDLAGGGILDVGGYPVSMARLIAGAAIGQSYADPVAVTAVGHVGETGADEWSVATLSFDGGVTAQVSAGVRLADQSQVRVYGSEGYLVVGEPWFSGDGKPTHVTLHRVGEAARDLPVEPVLIYAAEADAVAAAVWSGQLQAPEMTWADTLGNLTVLDAWRAAIGQQYASERDDAIIPTATGRPLARRDDAPMTYGKVPGLDKQVSRLVMGVFEIDESLPRATVMLDDFVERGGTTFDTAYIYGGGRGEKLLGQWMKSRGNRDEVVVIGKGAHTPHCDPESITRQLHESLERLQTDHVDLYLMHRDNEEIPVGEFVDVLHEHFKAGRITAYGGSNWSIERFDGANAYAEANGKQPFTLLSNHLSLARAYDIPWAGCLHVADDESQKWLRERQVALFPWSSQARGFFTGRAKPEDRSDQDMVRWFYSDENFRRLDRARELAAAHGVEPTAIALAWLLHQPYPVFPLIGPLHVSETRTSTPGLSVTLTDEEVAYLTA